MGSRFASLSTEKRNPRTMRLDTLSVEGILRSMDAEEPGVIRAVAGQRKNIAAGVRLMEKSVRSGGRIFFVGAGTSGRLGVMEAAECPPTFDTPPDLVQAIMAGGRGSVFRSREGAEDRAFQGVFRRKDVVVGIAASGVTPFVHGALARAKKNGAATILVTCNPVPKRAARVIITTRVGPEIITGSTRLKAGTATKLVLNRLTVATMVRIGKVYENLMVDLQPKSAKLRDRACRIIMRLTRADREKAEGALRASGNRVKIAVVMLRKKVSKRKAESLLRNGRLREALR